ncbi:MAG: hypothetical protein K8R21_04380 [Leptospira sp.]|nr:hypothetical protein [Leptospira sp.]
MSGLIRKSTKYGKDYYTVSGDYSDPKDLEKLNSYLEKEQLSFFDAMRLLAGNTFLRFCKASREENKKVILIEDGGYVSPFINDYILSKKSLNEVLEIFQIGPEKENPDFGEWIQGSLLGTVEHTRNGYDRLVSVQEKYSKLFFPAYSIAISENKVKEESKEVAHSILSAIESILHGQGMVLSQRKFIVLGSEGNIGRYLSEYLFSGRMHEKNRDLLKVDIKYTSGKDHCYYALDDIESELFLGRDLFIGVIGASILTERHIENLILNGNKTKLIFASGSTKTVEFSDLSEWLNKLAFSESPKIAGIPVSIEFERIQDPQSGIDQGGKIILSFEKNGLLTEKILYLLSDLSPINFLFYGVPTETMDTIISQLTSVSLGMVDQFRKSSLPVPALYAVDSHIDKWGHRI